MDKPEYVYWMPTNEPSFVMPYLHQFQVATVIKAVKRQQMDDDIYFLLLSNRIQTLIEQCDDPEDIISYTFDVLDGSSLIYERPSGVENAGRSLVFDNYLLREHLYLAGVFDEMPKELSHNNPSAEQLFAETDLEGWFDAVTITLLEGR